MSILNTMATTFKVQLLLLVFGFGIGATQHQPKITPEGSELIFSAGEDFTLTCTSSSRITWTYPLTKVGNDTLQPEVKIEGGDEMENGYYTSKLHVSNANDLAVGFYFCNITETNYSSTYVFVDDDNKLYVGRDDITVASGKQYSALIIPCRPTSPNITVRLYTGIGVDPNNEVSWKKTRLGFGHYGSRWSFDPKIGFVWDYPFEATSAIYTCHYSNDKVMLNKPIPIFIRKVFSYINKPLLRPWDGAPYHMEGDNLTLKCEVELEQQQPVTFTWMINGTEIKHGGKYRIDKSTPAEYSNLTIYSISRDIDSGNYTCKVSDDDNHESQSLILDILPKGTHFLYLSENNNITDVTCIVPCKPVVWNINVTSYPPGKITWSVNGNRQIRTDAKYNITNKTQESILEIKNVTVNDRGTYTIKVNNGIEERKFSVIVNVEGPPKVSINRSKFHLPNQEDTVNCIVEGFPKPNIYWKFKKCRLCDYEEIKSAPVKEKGLLFHSTAIIKTNQSGHIQCLASNIHGEDSEIKDYTVSDVKNGYNLEIKEDGTVLPIPYTNKINLAVGDKVTFECAITLQNYTNVTWFLNETSLTYIENIEEISSDTTYSKKKLLTIENMNYKHAGHYKCIAANERGTEIKEVHVKVIAPQIPKITSPNMKEKEEVIFPNSISLYCNYEGVPFPTITWYKNMEEIFEGDGGRIKFNKNKKVLVFVKTEQADEGEYMCKVQNRMGSVEQHTSIVVSNKQAENSSTIYIVLAVIAVLFLAVCVGLIIKIRKERELQKVLKLAGLQNFEKGAVESINPDLGIDDQAELLPYDKDSWEIPRDNIKLGKQLGAGAFGVVMKAELHRYLNNETPLAVAVKMIKKTADDTYLRALVSELKIMVHLGKHVNVVNLIGACTKHIVKRELYVVVEFCRFGNLHNYLLRHRENFINQIDPESGKLDYAIGAEILSRSFSISSNHSQEGTSKEMMDYRSNSNYNGPTQNTEVTLVSMSPTGGQGDEALLSNSNSSSTQPEWRSNYKGDYKGNVKPICTKDLLSWAFQVSRGMEYLSSRKVLHGDLAARNILLADNNVVKICDFGLAKSMYKSGNYKKKGDGPLPIKWMSVESIRDKVFSTQSDVWSYGIVLWEFFSLAKTPYPGMEADERLFQKLVDGYRMDAPTYATKDLYMLMLSCWEPKPQDRPSFEKLTDRIGNMLEDSVKRHYIDLNDPYLVMNTERFQNGQNDYLKMVSPPDFEKLSSPHYINEMPQVPKTATSDYMPMKSGNIFSPRQSEGQVFTFNDLNNKDVNNLNTPELTPMLRHDSDYETQPNTPKSPELPSYANPMYNKIDFVKEKNIIVNTPDNYVNMPKNKSVIKADKDDFVKDETHYVNHVSRDWETVQ